MVSAATLDDLNRFAREGRLGAGLVDFHADPLHPEAGSEVTLAWDFSDNEMDMGTLRIPGSRRVMVPAVGERRVRIGAEPVTVQLRVGNESAEVRIVPRIVIPVITTLRIHGNAVVGEKLTLSWSTRDAVRCELQILDGGHRTDQVVHHRGELELVPQQLGEFRVCLTTFSRHAALSDDARVRSETFVQVVPPPLSIVMPVTRQTVRFGDEALFRWTIYGAEHARIEAPDRGEVMPVPLEGQLAIAADYEVEQFRLVAVSKGGFEKSIEFRVIPRLLDISSPVDLYTLSEERA